MNCGQVRSALAAARAEVALLWLCCGWIVVAAASHTFVKHGGFAFGAGRLLHWLCQGFFDGGDGFVHLFC